MEFRRLGKVMAAILITITVLFTLGCGGQEYLNDDDEIIIGFVMESMTVERWQRDRDIFVAKAKELGAEVIVRNAYEDAELQQQIIRELVDQGVDTLAIIAYDKETLADAINYAKDNNVKVIAYDRLIMESDVDLYISFDNFQVGHLIGAAAIEAVPQGDYLILNGAETDYNATMLNEGCMQVLNPYIESGDITIVGETTIDAWRDEVSYQYVTNAIEQGIHFDVIIAANDRVAEGALKALNENRMTAEVFITGQDAELAACQRIVQGIQDMTVYKPIRVLAEGAAQIAVKLAKGEDIGAYNMIYDGKFEVKYIAYEPIAVTQDNMYDTVVKDGFFTVEQIYVNVDKSKWPE